MSNSIRILQIISSINQGSGVLAVVKNWHQMPDKKTKAQYATHAARWSTTQDYKELLNI